MDTQPEAGIYARESPYLERYVQVGIASGRVLSVSFPESSDGEDDHPLLDRIEEYLRGTADDFEDVEVALTMATDRRSALETLRAVPYGENVTIRGLARMTPGLDPESADDQTLLRAALEENPAPVVVPDHRVTDGPSAAPPLVEQRLRSLEGL
jgi:methylated-DNA-[protein]-cysteine S-methyltransferase